jgi:hypothetical protein
MFVPLLQARVVASFGGVARVVICHHCRVGWTERDRVWRSRTASRVNRARQPRQRRQPWNNAVLLALSQTAAAARAILAEGRTRLRRYVGADRLSCDPRPMHEDRARAR